jgi:hypothetical protein
LFGYADQALTRDCACVLSALVAVSQQVKQHNKNFRDGFIFRRIWFPKNAPASSEVLGIFWHGTPSGERCSLVFLVSLGAGVAACRVAHLM